MNREEFADRYRIELTYETDGTCTVRVTDIVTWKYQEISGIDNPTEEIARLLADELYPDLLTAPAAVAKISMIEIYRDGGSMGMCYNAHDKKPYEFFLPVAFNSDHSPAYYRSPILFYDHVNTHCVAYNFTWEEAEYFLKSIKSDDLKLSELIDVVSARRRHVERNRITK